MFVAILAILIGALQTARAVQEVVVQGVRESPRAIALLRAAAFLTLPVTVLIGFVWGLAGWPMRILGVAFPLFVLVYLRKPPQPTGAV